METLSFPKIDGAPAELVATKEALALPVVTLKSAALAHFTGLEAPLRALAERYRAVAFDLTTNNGMEAAKKARNDLRENGRYAVQRAEETFKDGVNDAKKAIAPKVAELIAIVRPVEDSVHAQIEARLAQIAEEKAEAERKETARKSAHEAGLSTLRGYVQTAAGKTAAQIASGILLVEGIVIGESWEEYAERAEAVKLATLSELLSLHDKAHAAEEAAAELLRKKAEADKVAEEQRVEAKRLKNAADALAAEQKRIADAVATLARQKAEFAEAQRKAAEPPQAPPEPVPAVVAPPAPVQAPAAPILAAAEAAKGAADQRVIAAETLARPFGGWDEERRCWCFTPDMLAALIDAARA